MDLATRLLNMDLVRCSDNKRYVIQSVWLEPAAPGYRPAFAVMISDVDGHLQNVILPHNDWRLHDANAREHLNKVNTR